MTKILLITEDKTDFDAVKEIILRICAMYAKPIPTVKPPPSFGGCSMIRRKAEKWIKIYEKSGFNVVIIVHDLDRNGVNFSLNDLDKLQKILNQIIVPKKMKKHICVPIEEIEAWLWTDENILAKIFKKPKKLHVSPHLISQPKEKLICASRDEGGKPLYNTNLNSEYAKILNIENCAKYCNALKNLKDFILSL